MGHVSKNNRRRILRAGATCIDCGNPADTVDHIIPISKGGPHAGWNLAPMCRHCNERKADSVRLDLIPYPHMAALVEYRRALVGT